MSRPPGTALRITGLTKQFGGTTVLHGTDLRVRAGTVHALLGGNGSGKSTTIKILAGAHSADGGTIEVGGRSWEARNFSAAAAQAAGLRFVHQDLGVFDDLTVAENIALASGWPTRTGARISWRALHDRVTTLLERFEIDADPRAPLGTLRPAARTMVAIARALQETDREDLVLVLDEPTASLPEHEASFLLESVRRRADQGQTVILVSHRLSEVIAVTDDYTVLRDGRVAGTLVDHRPTESELVELIAGRALDEAVRPTVSKSRPRPVLTVTDLTGGTLSGVDLEIGAGEIVGVAGLLGSGRTSLLRTLFGDHRPTSGTIELDGARVSFTGPGDAMRARVAYVPEDRGADAAFADLPLRANLSMSVLGHYWRRWRLDHGAERRDSQDLVSRYGVKAPSVEAAFSTLSGGNQQKAVLGRWLRRDPQLLLLDEPTQGVDVMSRADIYTVIRRTAASGCAVLVASSDLEELAALCDRVLVLHQGRVVAEADGEGLSADRLVHLVQRSPSLTSGART
ncbi:sugar ABC transporter ATP-binding protein [Saccharothrix sp. ALI-22-I]|uniref:sugar ABC transporter ATP-binding protein n=1 Tax=Saccharothrix sp. ALI-22-I TaxID=1933778 RepID=UPI0009FFC53E|nr:sugar ABC transporter ATP-binding protein [Saccharothrix sp. ALI-22-I]